MSNHEEDEELADPKDAILVMGLTGAGKTYFINQLTRKNLQEGHTLKSCEYVCRNGRFLLLTKEFRYGEMPDPRNQDWQYRVHSDGLPRI